MTGWQLFWTTWRFKPSLVAVCAALAVGYLYFSRYTRAQAAWFLGGVVVMFLTLVSPLEALGENYLFSAHASVCLLLGLVVPPMLILGFGAGHAERFLRFRVIRFVEPVFRYPELAGTIGLGALWFWHVPYLYNLALANPGFRAFAHLTFLVGGVIIWWPVLAPVPELRLHALLAMLYLFLVAFGYGVLGMLLAFAPRPYYAYGSLHDKLRAASLIRNKWGFSLLRDQNLGGTLMWVGASAVLMLAGIAVFGVWIGQPEEDEQEWAQKLSAEQGLCGSKRHVQKI